MAVLDSINLSRERGASDEQILNSILEANPVKKEAFNTALERGASPSFVLEEIIKQNTPIEQEKVGFLGGVRQDIQERGEEFAESKARQERGEQTPISTGIQLAGQTAGGAFDILGRGIKAVGRGISRITPDIIEDPIKERVKELGVDFIQSPPAQLALEAIKAGVDSYAEFKKKDPVTAENIESIVNVGLLFAPVKGIRTTEAVTTKATSEVAKVAERKLAKQVSDEAIEITKPVLSIKEKKLALEAGRGERRGVLRETTLTPSATDVRVAKSVENIVKGSNPIRNIDAIRNEIGNISKITDEGLKKNNTIFNSKQLKSALNQTKEESKIIFGTDKTLQNNYNAVIDEMVRISNKHLKTLSGLRTARIEFDQIVKQKFPNIFKKIGGDNVRSNAVMDVRRTVNDFIATKLPEGNEFKPQLQRMSDMYKAIKNISGTTAGIVDVSRMERIIKVLRQNPVVAGVTGGILTFGALTGLLSNPLVIGTLVAGGSIKIGQKIVTAKIVKKAMIEILGKLESSKAHPNDIVLIKEFINSLEEEPQSRDQQ